MTKKIKNKWLRFFYQHTLGENLFFFFGRERRALFYINTQKKNKKNLVVAKQTSINPQLSFRSERIKKWEEIMLSHFSPTTLKKKRPTADFLKSSLHNSMLYSPETISKGKTTVSNKPVGMPIIGVNSPVLQLVSGRRFTTQSRAATSQACENSFSVFDKSVENKKQSSHFSLPPKNDIFASTFERVKFMASVQQIKTTLEPKQMQGKTVSQYKHILTEARKLRFLYGNISRRDLFRAITQAERLSGVKNENLLILLESRLDVILQRSGFCSTIRAAKQLIRSNKVKVNKKKIRSPGYLLNPGDLISIDISKSMSEGYVSKPLRQDLSIDKARPHKITDNGVEIHSILNDKFVGSKASNKTVENSFFPSNKIHEFVSLLWSGYFPRDFTILQKSILKAASVKGSKIHGYGGKSVKMVSTEKLGFGFAKAQHTQNQKFVGLSSSKNILDDKGTNSRFDLSSPPANPEGMPTAKKQAFVDHSFYNLKKSCITNKWRFKGSPFLISLFSRTKKLQSLLDFKEFAHLYDNVIANIQNRINKKQSFFSYGDANIALWFGGHAYANEALNKTLFSISYALYLKKELQALSCKKNCFGQQKLQKFFDHQTCLPQKVMKPLHLEISYKSLAIIFLYPPQRICLPTYIDLDSILKRFPKS